MTRNDAQLLYDWLVRQYGDPSEGPATTTFGNRDAYYQRETNQHAAAGDFSRLEFAHSPCGRISHNASVSCSLVLSFHSP